MKTLIVYFSWSNNTKKLVEAINKEFNFDVVRVEWEVTYSNDYNTCAYVEDKLEVESDLSDDKLKELAISAPKTAEFIQGKTIVKTIVVSNKLVNIVVK